MFQSFNNQGSPYIYDVTEVLQAGNVITVCGEVLKKPNRFQVDLQHGDDIVLHFNPRYDKSYEYVVHNTLRNGYWGSEEWTYESPFPNSKPFAIQIFVTHDTYKISANGKPFSEYKHRIPFSNVDSISVGGMVKATLIDIQHIETSYAPVPGPFNVPYKSIIYGGLKNGKTIIMQGFINKVAKRIEINLQHKTGIAFFYCCDFEKNVVVRNSYENGCWGEEEKSDQMPFKPGQPFQVIILSEVNKYLVFSSGEQVHTYDHRFTELQDIDVLEISGDLQLTFVQP